MAKVKTKQKPKPNAKKQVKKPVPKQTTKKVAKPAPKAVKKPAAKPAAKTNKTTNSKTTSKVISNVTPAKPLKSAKNKPAKRVKLPEGYRPTDKEEYMNPNQLEYFRQKLLAWKLELSTELQETLDNLKEENWQESDITDRATVEIDTGIELRTRDRYRKLINKIDSALTRIDRGDYGYCEETGEEIGVKRLEARPIATLSVEAQERHERDERTHYDEDLEERL